MDSLFLRREKLLYRYGNHCLKLNETKDLFPLREKAHTMNSRYNEKYQVLHTNTERLRMSTVPYIQRMLNKQLIITLCYSQFLLCLVVHCTAI